MCGLAGFFVGCEVEHHCPYNLLKSQKQDEFEYDSPLDRWDTNASVRNKPRRVVSTSSDPDLSTLFPKEYIPVIRHPDISVLDEQVINNIQIHHLYRYFDFTTKLEIKVVNETTKNIALDSAGFDLPNEMVLDAYRVYCDEGYHAFFSADIIKQVYEFSEVRPVMDQQHFFLRSLQEIKEDNPDLAYLVEIFFVIVSETLITGYLADVKKHKGVNRGVIETISDHAIDEGRHHAYYKQFLYCIWPQLSTEHKKRVSLMIPRLIRAFLTPDITQMQRELVASGVPVETAHRALGETYTAEAVEAHLRGSVPQLVRYLGELEVFGIGEAFETFQEAGIFESSVSAP